METLLIRLIKPTKLKYINLQDVSILVNVLINKYENIFRRLGLLYISRTFFFIVNY